MIIKKYLLASAGSGVGFLCLIAGLLPAQAVPNFKFTDDPLTLSSSKDLSLPKTSISQEKVQLYNNLKTLENSTELIASTDGEPQVLPNENQNQEGNDLEITVTPDASSPSSTPDETAQVTSVSQLSDVQPTDWAFQALQSLVERYGCIAGYPNGTYRGDRAMTRYEFAAGVNACLDRVNELIATATTDLVKQEDLTTLQKLQEEFAAELATLRGRVDALEASTAKLEAAQFSTTTKLNGEVIFAGIGAVGGAPDDDNPSIILPYRVRLNFNTSFTGKDVLITGLQAYNFLGGLDGTGSLQDSLGLASPLLSASSARVSFEPQFPGIDPRDLSPIGANEVRLYKVLYVFPVADQLTLFAGPAAEASDAFPAITPFFNEGQESISRFAGLNPVVRISGGTSGFGLASAAGFIWNISNQFDLRAFYASVNANIVTPAPDLDVLPGVSGNILGAGLFGGSNVVSTQLTIKPTKNLDIGLNYAYSYHEINILGTGLVSADIGGALEGLPLAIPVNINSVGGTFTWRFAPNVALSGYGAALFVEDSSGRADASTTYTSGMIGLHFTDLFKKGNNAGLIFGQPLYRTTAGGDANIAPEGADRAVPLHLEGYYRFSLNNNISITPGAFVLFNPESNSNNDTTIVGVLRTTLTF